MKKNIAIITAVSGKRDILRNPTKVFKNADYYAVVSKDITLDKSNNYWKILPIINYHVNDRWSERINARFVKIMPQFYIKKKYDYIVWIDACFDIVINPQDIIDEFMKEDTDFVSFNHPWRSCSYLEMSTCVAHKKDHRDLIEEQGKFYIKEKFPTNAGLFASGCIIRKNNERLDAFNRVWWEQITRFSSRDQLSLTYSLWKEKINYAVIQEHIYTGKYTKNTVPHRTIE